MATVAQATFTPFDTATVTNIAVGIAFVLVLVAVLAIGGAQQQVDEAVGGATDAARRITNRS